MTRSRHQLIQSLADDLMPVKRPGRIAHWVAAWLAVSWVYTVLILSATGPWRPGALTQLVSSPQFAFESVLGVLAGTALIATALALGIPQTSSPWRRALPALLLAALWASSYVVGLWHPALDPSMLGKREWCFFETLLYGALPLAVGLLMLRRLMPVHPMSAGFTMGLAAGSLPALGMQFACMYAPEHTLSHHLAPALLVGVLGALIAPWALKKRTPAR